MASNKPMSMFGPDFPFAHDDWLSHPAGLGTIPPAHHGKRVAIIGAGMAGLTAGYELMRLGLHPTFYESGQLGGRLRSQPFEGAEGIVAELGGMRFPRSATCFGHYTRKLGLTEAPFPNPLSEAAYSTLIDLEGAATYIEAGEPLPAMFREVQEAYDAALESGARAGELRAAIAARDAGAVKALWNPLVEAWDERSFYDFIATAPSFRRLGFRQREIFGQVGFGTGGWDSDFPNSMLEILRVAVTDQDEAQHLIVGGAEQVPQWLWRRVPERMVHWPSATSLSTLNGAAPRPGVTRLRRAEDGTIEITDRWGRVAQFEAVIVTCQSWLLTTAIDSDESLFGNKLWMAMDRTRYMQSSKTFVMTDRAFWKDKDPVTGRHPLSMTLTDRLTRGTYLFDNGPGKPGVICLTYSWASDAMKMLPLDAERRVELALDALGKIYPDVDLRKHIVGDPITVSWEADPNFLGAFKGALPGHYRYNRRMFAQFMQRDLPPAERGVSLAGDDIGWTPGWVEGAVQTALNAVWGVMHQFGGSCAAANPGPGDCWDDLKPLELPE